MHRWSRQNYCATFFVYGRISTGHSSLRSQRVLLEKHPSFFLFGTSRTSESIRVQSTCCPNRQKWQWCSGWTNQNRCCCWRSWPWSLASCRCTSLQALFRRSRLLIIEPPTIYTLVRIETESERMVGSILLDSGGGGGSQLGSTSTPYVNELRNQVDASTQNVVRNAVALHWLCGSFCLSLCSW